MNILKTLTILALVAFGVSFCDKPSPTPSPVTSQTFKNLYAPQVSDYTVNPPAIKGEFIKFDFSTGDTTKNDKDWDIAFRGTTILVNGGTSDGLTSEPSRTGNAAVYITNGSFASITSVKTDSFAQDGANGLAIPTGSKNGWYTYNPTNNSITATAGKVLVFRTADGKYAKVEILSYYKDAPSVITTDIATNDGRHYTFNYVYQPNDGVTTFQ